MHWPRSRNGREPSEFSLKIRQGKNRLEVTADNADEILPVIRELMDGS
jgi:hypothetical protein